MLNKRKIGIIILIVIALFVMRGIFLNFLSLIANPTQTYTVNMGKLTNEESANATIVRKENVITDGKSRIDKIIQEGERVSKNQNVARKILPEEEKILEKIASIDGEIEKNIAENQAKIKSVDNVVLDNKIEGILAEINGINNQSKVESLASEINTNILEKAKLSGELSKEGSKIKELMEKKKAEENKLNHAGNVIKSPTSGLVSYKIDGKEGVINPDNFDKLTEKALTDIQVKAGNQISESDKFVKIVPSFKTYLIAIFKSDISKDKEVGDEVEIRIENNIEVDAEITNIIEIKGGKRIFVFSTDKSPEVLLNYRKKNVSIIWWTETGIKVSNDAIVEINGNNYVQKDKSGFTEIVPVRVVKKSGDFSLIQSITKKELKERGVEEADVPSIQEFDEIVMNPRINDSDVKTYEKVLDVKKNDEKEDKE